MPRVLVTGAARGIGRATALHLASRGWEVIAGVRRAEDGEELVATHPGAITSVMLDVTDAAHVAALDAAVPAQLDGLVNNAGIAVAVPVEAVALADLRHQLEVNVVGQAAVTQALLPRLRASRGRVVFVSSVSGRIATPMFGPYNASKFALEGMADALRLELAPWGIGVVLVEPAQTDTDVWRNAEETASEVLRTLSEEHRALYSRHISGFVKTLPRVQKLTAPAQGVAETIEKALTARRPRARYVVGAGPRAQAAIGLMLPTRVRDAALRAASGVPRKL